MTNISCEITDSLGMIHLEKKDGNTFTRDFLDEFKEGIQSFCQNNKVRVIQIESKLPQVFSHGINPKSFLHEDMTGRIEIFRKMFQLVETVCFAGIPVVMDINGDALAGGAVLALVADFSVAALDYGKICFSEVKVGVPIPPILFDLASMRVPANHMNHVFYFGKNYRSHEAQGIGLVDFTYEDTSSRQRYLEDIYQRTGRLSRAVLAETLLARKQFLSPLFAQFYQSLDNGQPFLSDEYLGFGLKALINGENPAWS